MKRDSVIIVAVSLCSILAGVLIYRYTLFEPEFVSAKPLVTSQHEHAESSITYSDVVLKNLDGQHKYLTDWDNPIQILNFWAPWCAPCRREIPALIELQSQYRGDVQIIGLSFDSQKNVRNFQSELPINYPLLLVGIEAAQINGFFGNSQSGLPFTVILNQQREIVYRHTGEVSGAELEHEIKTLLSS
ncbi:MAG: TlpA disulfide reductase family protein [Gammaproteobacteria bacterium]|nr:TlpA disulfide reductase family protein [Gammaproteobacteria bacterium]